MGDEEFLDPLISEHCPGQARPWRSSPQCPPSTSNSPPQCPSPCCPPPPTCPPAPCRPRGSQGGPEDDSRAGGVRAAVLHPAGRCEGCRPGGYSEWGGILHSVRPNQRGFQESARGRPGGSPG